MIPMYYKGTKSIIVVFDITDITSFEGAKKWINEVNQNVKDASIILVGNKSDLEENRKRSRATSQFFAKENNYDYIETSAKDNININALFEIVSKKIELLKDNEDLSKVRINKDSENNNNRGWCC